MVLKHGNWLHELNFNTNLILKSNGNMTFNLHFVHSLAPANTQVRECSDLANIPSYYIRLSQWVVAVQVAPPVQLV